MNPQDIFGKLKRKILCLFQENKEGSPLFEQGQGGCLKYWCCYKRPGDRMVVHLCWCLFFSLFSCETSLFIYAGGSLHSADEGSENEQWTLWTREELSAALLSPRLLLTLTQHGVGGKSWLLSPAMLSCLGLINQLDLFSHSFRHL